MTAQQFTDFWARVQTAREVIDDATEDGSYATLSNRTDLPEHLVHWRTAEAIAERLPRVYKISGSPLGDYRRICNIRMLRRLP